MIALHLPPDRPGLCRLSEPGRFHRNLIGSLALCGGILGLSDLSPTSRLWNAPDIRGIIEIALG